MSTAPDPDPAATTFALHYTYADDPDRLDAIRPDHRAFLRELHDEGTLVLSGPYADDGPAAALIIVRGASAEEVLRRFDEDPFRRAGLIARRELRPWSIVIGELPSR